MHPGYFAGLRAKEWGEVWEVSWNLGFANREYRNPDGERARFRTVVGWEAVLRPTVGLHVEGGYINRSRQPSDWFKQSLYPEGRIFFEYSESWHLGCRSETVGESETRGAIEAAVQWKGNHTRSGQLDEEMASRIEGSLFLSSYTISIGVAVSQVPFWEGTLSYSRGAMSTSVSWRRGFSPPAESEFTWEGSLGSPAFRLKCQVVRKKEKWAAVVGWIARIGSRFRSSSVAFTDPE